MNNPNELYLILKKEFFNQILSGEKKEEYRTFSDFYIQKLCVVDKENFITDTKKFETVRFQLGYSKNAPQIVVECKNVLIDVDPEVKEDEDLTSENSNFVIILGDILEKINL